MNPKKIFLFIIIILGSMFFNINNTFAKSYTYNFKYKSGKGDDSWNYKKLLSSHVADLCSIGSTSSTCKSNGNAGACYAACTLTLKNPNYDKKLNPNVPENLKVAVKYSSSKLVVSENVKYEDKKTKQKVTVSSSILDTRFTNDMWTTLEVKIPSEGRLGEAERYFESIGVCPKLKSEMIKDGKYVQSKIKDLKYPENDSLADICKKGGLVTAETIADDIGTKYNDDGTKKDSDSDKSVEWPDKSDFKDLTPVIGGKMKIGSCEDLLGKDLIDIIQTIVNIARVMIPIGLIVFGVLDFGKALFLSDEGEMKKSQSKFIKRLIVAIAFFLIPTVIGLLLKIANSIWGGIDTSLCGIKF